jgi:hypothetical protein
VSDEHFLSRWSRMKHASAARPPATAEPAATTPPIAPNADKPQENAPVPLPPVESLTPESDFTPFMGAEVDPAVRRGALKKLFADPQFNVMDGLDVYIDDYSKPDPLPEGWLEKMNQVARLGIFVEKNDEAERVEALAASNTAVEVASPAEVGKSHVSAVQNLESSGVHCTKNRHDDAEPPELQEGGGR